MIAWTLRRVLTGHGLNGEISALPEPFRRLARHLDALPMKARQGAWDAFLCGRADADILRLALANADADGPPPEAAPVGCYATLADIARIVSDQPWLWRGWIAHGVLNVVASEPGTGKTRFALDLARRLYFGLPWPDGQANELPAGTRTLWVQGDRNFAEMLQAARDFGLPDEAVTLGSSPEEPTGALDLDDPETLDALAGRIEAVRPALVVIDTVGMVTARNLCRPEEARAFFGPIMELAGKLGVAVLGQTHLSKGGEALGRRIVEKARVVIKMTQPDPEGQRDRRRLWVDKTAVTKPPALGITMGDAGNDYDSCPPTEPEAAPRRPGPPPAKLTACKEWLAGRLTPNPARVSELRKGAAEAGLISSEQSAGTLYAARDALGVNEYELDGRKWWKLTAETGPEGIDPDRPF